MAAAIEAVGTGDFNHLRSRYKQPMSVIGDIARALVCAPVGRKPIVADFSGIEFRLTAWVSGQRSKLDQWANFDRSGDPEDEPYFITGHKIFGMPKDQAREPGKTAIWLSVIWAAGAWLNGTAWRRIDRDRDQATPTDMAPRAPLDGALLDALDRAAKSAVRLPAGLCHAAPCLPLLHQFVSAHAAAERTQDGLSVPEIEDHQARRHRGRLHGQQKGRGPKTATASALMAALGRST